jgi:nicotinamide mononucleotide adenylyltransferase
MTLSIYRSGEPLYIVIMRDPEARSLLTRWTTTSRSIQARVEDNRMHIYDHNTLSLFTVTWTHSWDHVVIWDPWAKRHVNI